MVQAERVVVLGVIRMSISLKEIIKTADFSGLPKDTQDNLMTLLERINKIRTTWGKAMTVTSGLRTMEQHLAIYAKKGITDKTKIPMKSQHLKGAAVDIAASEEFKKWIKNNVKLLETVSLWCEDLDSTPNWIHFQIYPPKSGNRFFKP